MIAVINNLKLWVCLIGIRSAFWRILLAIGKHIGLHGPKKWKVKANYIQYAVVARLRKNSDMTVFAQIFLQEEYRFIRKWENIQTIVDLGANVGYSSVYFLNIFPKATIYSVEPDAENYKICKTNLDPYGDRCKAVYGAVWSHCTSLAVHRDQPDGDDWSCKVREGIELNSRSAVPAWDVDTLLTHAGLHSVDLLKGTLKNRVF